MSGTHGSCSVPLTLHLLQGEVGQSKLTPFASLEAAKKDFEKKFREKTKNSWAARESFVAQPGKYTLIEVQPGAGQELEVTVRVRGQPGHHLRAVVLHGEGGHTLLQAPQGRGHSTEPVGV